jgi:hypothetical protein
MDVCWDIEPELMELSPGIKVRCHLFDSKIMAANPKRLNQESINANEIERGVSK